MSRESRAVLSRNQRRTQVHTDQTHLDAVLALREEDDDLVLFCEVNGKPIAKRYSGENWLSLEPGWTVRGGEPVNYDTIEIEYSPRFEIELGKVIYEPGARRTLHDGFGDALAASATEAWLVHSRRGVRRRKQPRLGATTSSLAKRASTTDGNTRGIWNGRRLPRARASPPATSGRKT
jgi:hypothetical protein